jgi:hypothetical protein
VVAVPRLAHLFEHAIRRDCRSWPPSTLPRSREARGRGTTRRNNDVGEFDPLRVADGRLAVVAAVDLIIIHRPSVVGDPANRQVSQLTIEPGHVPAQAHISCRLTWHSEGSAGRSKCLPLALQLLTSARDGSITIPGH